MKRALLTLTMVCALPISSLNAGWNDWMPTLPSWRAQPEPSGAPAFKENDGCSDDYKQAARPIMNTMGQINTQKKCQSYLDAAKKYGWYTAAGIGSAALLLATIRAMDPVKFKKHGAMFLNPLNAFALGMFGLFSKDNMSGLIGFGLTASEIATSICACKSGYNLLQAQRYEKQDIRELEDQFKTQQAKLNQVDFEPLDVIHASNLQLR